MTWVALVAPVWVALGLVLLVCAALASRSPRAQRAGELALAGLYLPAGALVNAVLLLRGEDYAGFADGSWSAFVRDTWQTLVVPHAVAWIFLLILFELSVGTLAVVGGRAAQVAVVAAAAFHVALVAFGWGFALWSAPICLALVLLLQAQRRHRNGSAASRGRRPVALAPTSLA